MKRVRHYLKQNKAQQRPTRHLFVDVESRLLPKDDERTDHVLWFGWACYWRRRPSEERESIEWLRFETLDELWEWVTSKTKSREPLYLISHNVSYDFGVLRIFDSLEARDFVLSSFWTSGMATIAEFKRKGHKIVLLDNGNYFPGALAKWGDAIGFPKGEADPLTDPVEIVDPYCHRDVEIMVRLWRDLYGFLDLHALGNWGKTLPSQAFSAYRHRFMANRIVIHANTDALALERQAYHGGRASVFYKGRLTDGPYYKLDVNSMYPHVMATERYPNDLLGVKSPVSLAELEERIEHYAVIARVQVRTDSPCYPVKHKTHVVYPVGTFDTTLTTPELVHGLARGHILYVRSMSYYMQAELFTSYVGFFYGLKQALAEEPSSPYYAFAKLYLNSLYGKFGQLAHHWERLEGDSDAYADSDFYVNLRTGQGGKVYRFGSTIWTCEVKGESFNSFPAIAAHVTAYARMYLWRVREIVGPAHFFYTDTDSILTDAHGLAAMSGQIDATALGAWKIEETSDTMHVQAPKVYAFAGKVKRKGVPAKATYLGNDTWEFDKFTSFKGQAAWEEGEQYHTVKARRHLSYRIHDGHETATGWIEPLDAGDLWPEQSLTEEGTYAIESWQAEIDALHNTLRLDSRTVFAMWDYRKGAFRRGKDSRGEMQAMEYSLWDTRAGELGFPDLRALKAGVLAYLETMARIHELERKIYNVYQGPMPDREPHSRLEEMPLLF